MRITGLLRELAPRLRGALGEAAVARVLRGRCEQVANDVILPDGRGGLTQIDHLALGPEGILVIETKSYSGLVLGQRHELRWTQVIGRQRHSFQNPLRQNYAHIEAVRALVPGIPVVGHVVFLDRARFPKGRPPGVVNVDGLRRILPTPAARSAPSPYGHAWETLLAVARRDAAAREAHLAGLRARFADTEQASSPWPVIRAEARPPPPRSPDWDWARLVPLVGVAAAIVVLGVGALRQPDPRPAVKPEGASLKPERPPPAVRSSERAQITWSDPLPPPRPSEACSLARVAVLIDHTAASRAARDAACGDAPKRGQQSAATARETQQGSAATARVVTTPWRTRGSAAQLTRQR